MHSKIIDNLAVKISKSKAGSHAYLRNYNKARRQIERKLSRGQRQKYKAMAAEWSNSKLPRRVQQRYAHGNDFRRLELLISLR
jgi:hypothetical protein